MRHQKLFFALMAEVAFGQELRSSSAELGLSNAKQILDYTHAKQNISIVKKLISDALKLSDKQSRKLSKQVRELLLKKLNDYFGDHSRFRYQTFRNNGLPTGSGTVESAIRRVINLRIKGTGLFWKREHAENIIFLRSLVLTGKLKNACRKGLGLVRNMFDNNTMEKLPLVA